MKSIVQEVVDRPDWISGNHLMVLVSGSGKRKAKSYNASADKSPKLTIEYLLPGSQPEEVFYFHNDHLGTPQAMTDAGGSVVWQADYKPFGEANVHTETIENNLRFPGQYYDAESGLHYNYFRDYDPGTGRYVESDPIGLRRGGINTYVYVGGNPSRYIDLDGLLTITRGFSFTIPGIFGLPGGSATVGYAYSFPDPITGGEFDFGWFFELARDIDQIGTFGAGVSGGGRGVILDLSPREEIALASCLREVAPDGSYGSVSNNCGNPWLRCLERLKVLPRNWPNFARVLPVDFWRIVSWSPRAVGIVRYPGTHRPVGERSSSTPAALP